MDKKCEKLKHLDNFLKENHAVTLSRALGESDNKIAKIIKGKSRPSKRIIRKTADFFFLDEKVLLDDKEKLPEDKKIQVDKDVISILKDDYDNKVSFFKNRHILARNYRVLSHGKRVSLWLSCLIVGLPLLGYVGGVTYVVANDRVQTIEKYKHADEMSDEQKSLEKAVQDNTEANYANVKVGIELEKIANIDHSSNSYTVRLSTWFDIDQIDFHEMYWEYYKGSKFNADGFYTGEDLKTDCFCFSDDGSTYLEYADHIPDVIQFNYASGVHPSADGVLPVSISTLYTKLERPSYPGEQQSNNFTDHNDEFYLGNGSFTPDTVEYREKGRAYLAEDGSFRFYQKVHFDGSMGKSFDNPRYPLDSLQFHIYVQPNRSTDYIRYEVADSLVVDGNLVAYNGFSSMFGVGNGYRLIKETDEIKNLSKHIYYLEDSGSEASTANKSIKTELEFVVRVNKDGISSFIKAFINIFAVGIWMIIAFFNQSYNRENSIDMIGTGLFAGISSVMIGISMISDADIFSLITMINIFTLAVILIMAYEAIAAKHTAVKQDKEQMAYRTVKLRIMFYLLTLSSLLIFIGLPLIAYIFTL